MKNNSEFMFITVILVQKYHMWEVELESYKHQSTDDITIRY